MAFAVLLGIALILAGCSGGEGEDGGRGDRPAPVAVAPVTRGSLALKRTFSGTLSPHASFTVTSKVSGRLDSIRIDISDEVRRGQVVALVDDAEYIQKEAQAEADLAVAEAELIQARSALEIAERENQRVVTLRDRGVASDAQFDTAQADLAAAQARLRVAEARKNRAEALLESARIRLGYTRVTADWPEGDDRRVVADRYLDGGQVVSANDPILRIVQIDPVVAEIFVTERDYTRLRPGQRATLTTDAFPGESFVGEIERVAPVFREATRQALVELRLANPDYRLKPGMFVRATLTLDQAEDAVIIPESALTRRQGTTGVFVLDEETKTVRWQPVTPGIQDGDRLQVMDTDLTGRVVTLGQHLVDDGSEVVVAREDTGP